MNHAEYIKLRRRWGENLDYCRWCYRWKPNSGLRNFMGTKICKHCYERIRKGITGEITNFIRWINKNTPEEVEVEIRIEKDQSPRSS